MDYSKVIIELIEKSESTNTSLKELIEDYILKASLDEQDLDDLFEEINTNEVLKSLMMKQHLESHPNIYNVSAKELLF